MAVSDLVHLSALLDDAKCFALVRQRRWPKGVCCPDCDLPAPGQLALALAVAEEPEVADAVEAIREDMDQEPADELVGGQGHRAVVGLPAAEAVRLLTCRRCRRLRVVADQLGLEVTSPDLDLVVRRQEAQ